MDSVSIRKILELERQKDFSDTAVFGGLDKFLSRWAAKTESSINSPADLRKFRQLKLDKTGYSLLDKQQRKAKIEEILGFIEKLETPVVKKASKPANPAVSPAAKPRIKTAVTKTAQGTSLDASITTIKGVSTTVAAKFNKLGASTIRDLLYYFPNRHLDYSQRKTISELKEGIEETIIANVWQVREVRLGNRRSTEAIVGRRNR
jgi:ATP-dependent DNA helicase RecG